MKLFIEKNLSVMGVSWYSNSCQITEILLYNLTSPFSIFLMTFDRVEGVSIVQFEDQIGNILKQDCERGKDVKCY